MNEFQQLHSPSGDEGSDLGGIVGNTKEKMDVNGLISQFPFLRCCGVLIALEECYFLVLGQNEDRPSQSTHTCSCEDQADLLA